MTARTTLIRSWPRKRSAVDDDTKFFLIAAFTVLILASIGLRLGYVQIFRAPSFQEVAAGNRIRVVQTAAPRGLILDSAGNVMAGNRDSLTVTLDWEQLVELSVDERRQVFSQLVRLLSQPRAATGSSAPVEGLSIEQLDELYDRASVQALEPIAVAEDVTAEQWVSVRERDLPGIEVIARPVRTYPYGASAAHVLGYLSLIHI